MIDLKASVALFYTFALLIGFCAHPARAQEAAPRNLTIGFVELTDDARYEPIRATERIVLRAPQRPVQGANLGIDDAAALARVTGVTLALQKITTEPGKIAAAIATARQAGTHLFLLDVPASTYPEITAALAFNVSAADDKLRRNLCAREIVHTIPSQAMRMDALMQHLVSRKWRDILLLEGPEPEDADMASALTRSAKKLGARIVTHTRFKLGNAPRDRNLNNPALLTAINREYDIVFVADASLEMARQVENFAGTMNFVIFPMFFISSALYPLWKLREGGAEIVYLVAMANPFTYAVELCRFALYGMFNATAAAVVIASAVVFFVAAVLGYDPQSGMIRRTRGGS